MEPQRLTPPVQAGLDHFKGPPDASLTLVEYGDFECPGCGEAYPEVKELERRLGGQLAFVFRNFPVSERHPHADLAAEAAEAAGAQGRFWGMHDRLFENQNALALEDLRRYAGEIGLELDRFDADLRSRAWWTRVRQHVESGERSGVRGTPTFFINGRRHQGFHDAETLAEVLHEATSGPARS